MLMTVKWLRLLSYFGSGQQMVSWIHIDDLCQVFLKTIQQDRLSGIINAVSPQPVDNKTMTDKLQKSPFLPGQLLHRPSSSNWCW
jgi:hypothetical protein